jgi:transcriptional regulator with XRE-family HTH domain
MPESLNGPRINDRLAELDLSPADFADRNEISEGYFRNLRNGSDQCSLRTAHRIARGLALPVDEVLEKKNETKEEPTHPTRRQDTEKTSGPKRADTELRAAS